jgi:hypothetical protein
MGSRRTSSLILFVFQYFTKHDGLRLAVGVGCPKICSLGDNRLVYAKRAHRAWDANLKKNHCFLMLLENPPEFGFLKPP